MINTQSAIRGWAAAWVFVAAGCTSSGPVESPPDTTTPAPVKQPGGRTVVPFSTGLKVVANQPFLLDGPGQNQFVLPNLRELLLRVSIPSVPSSVLWLTVDLVTPSGVPYLRAHTPFSTDPNITQVPSPDGMDRPVDVSRIKTIDSGYALDTSILIGGTAMVRNAEGGAWRLSVQVDGFPAFSFEQTLDIVVPQ